MGERAAGPHAELPVRAVRARLGPLVQRVAQGEGPIGITSDGAPDGALVSEQQAEAAGLVPVASWGAREARDQWADVRRLAAQTGPQLITHREGGRAVLVDAAGAAAAAGGVPLLPFDVLETGPGGRVMADGRPVPPGTYVVPGGGRLVVNAEEEEG
ncbi:type II toxin-antitoxin system prevent-host-death family antitoxin [Allonocardiopsis opalescens]|uniref:Prevent-host-death family protein n=1 Tax=Allonocardiopsis opalescens TaxID=1144618 RepID=A0A2T0Q7J8_9ACTN|nr:type II toxin-antitoxin system prevent-host-death family antitoxin [Allonocardiopsis opalescens]PRX99810.1 prevent-host-death family protein [Allonocardiopsis opalescens]